MPEHKSYLEPYFGSGAVFFRKTPSRIETINDMDSNVVNLFRCIQEDADQLSRLVATTPYSREVYFNSFESGSTDPYERALAFLIKCWQGHGFRICYTSGWKNDVAGREYAYAVRYWNQLPEWILQIVHRLKQAQIEQMPAVDLIRRFNRPEVLVYADPPYLLSTRKMKKQYNHEMTENDHIELLDVLQEHQGPVILSGYDNSLYDGILASWEKYRRETTAEKGLRRIETIWVKKGGAKMPRKKENARNLPRPRRLRRIPRAVVVPWWMWKDDGMSPGRLMAVAEWRD